jgi:hypothetical protein
MRIVVSDTHASGKSILISDFTLRHPGFTVPPDPFELLDEASDVPSAAMLSVQLRLSAERLRTESSACGSSSTTPMSCRPVCVLGNTGDPRTRRGLLEQAL